MIRSSVFVVIAEFITSFNLEVMPFTFRCQKPYFGYCKCQQQFTIIHYHSSEDDIFI